MARGKSKAAAGKPTARKRGRPSFSDTQASAPIAILQLALEEFGRHGFEGANIGEIAAKAGVAKPLVHYHYESKEKLWQSAVSYAMDKLGAEFRNMNFELRDLDPIAAISVVIRRYTYFCVHNYAATNIVVMEVVRGTDRAKWLTERYLKPLFLVAETFLQAATAKGQIRKVSPAHLLSLISGAINGFFAFSGPISEIYGVDALSDESATEHAEMVVDIVLNGLKVR